MAFDWKRINKHADFSEHKMFHYKTDDTHTAVSTSGYFNDAVKTSNLETGDIITAVTSASGTPVMREYIVTVNASTGVVTTAQQTVS